MNENNKNEIPNEFQIINLNNYVVPEIKPHIGTKYILNGSNNYFFKFVNERYKGSSTNSSIIDAFVSYTIGDGLFDTKGLNVEKYISKQDVRLICHDFKLYGQASIQIIWSQGSKLLKELPKPIRIKHIPTEKLGLNQNKLGEVDGYWYSFDWDNQNRYKPTLFPKYDGVYKEHNIEILTIKRTTSEPYFPQPAWSTCLQSCMTEEQLQNYAYNFVVNGFSGGTIIKVKGIPATEELREIYKRKIEKQLTGTSNANRLIVSYVGDDGSGDITVEVLPIKGIDSNFTIFKDFAKQTIFDSHGVVNPILFGVRDGSGLGSNKDEMNEALKHIYIQKIDPMREVIIDGLESVLKQAEPDISLFFKNSDLFTTSTDPETPKNI